MARLTVVLLATMVVYFCFVGCGSLVGMGSGTRETKSETPIKKTVEKTSGKAEEVKKQTEPTSVKSESENKTKPKSDSQPKTVDPKSLLPFSAESVTPEHKEVGSPVDSRIIVDFNKPIDQTTINAGTFTVSGAVSGPASGMFIFSSGSNTGRVVFTPDLDFIAGEMVTVTLSHNIKDFAGTALSWFDTISDKAYTWRFVTDTEGHSVVFTDSGQELGSGGSDAKPSALILADADADGDLDAFLANWWGGPGGLVRINDGFGFFNDTVLIRENPSKGMAVGDLNGDGISDVLINDDTHGLHSVHVLRGLMGGHAGMQVLAAYLPEGDPQWCGVSRCDGNLGHRGSFSEHNVGDRRGMYSGIITDPDSLELRDMDGDGDLDPVVGWIWKKRCHELPYCYQFNGHYSLPVEWDLFELPWVWLNTPYLVSGNPVNEAEVDFKGSTTAFNMVPPGAITSKQGGCCDGTMDIEIGDLDGDDDLDMVTINTVDYSNNSFSVHGYGERINEFRVSLNDSSVPDSTLEFNPENQVIQNLPLSNSRRPSPGQLSVGHTIVTFEDVELGDMDGDGDVDALVAGSGGALLLINDGFGSFSFNDQLIHEFPVSDAALGDLDGDGDIDAVFSGYDPEMFSLTVGGNTGFSPGYQIPPFPHEPADNFNRIFINDGFGSFTDSSVYVGDGHSTHISLGDLDLDGDLDAFVRNDDEPRAYNTVWFNNTPPLYQVPLISIGEAQPSGPSPTGLPSTSGIGIASVLPGPTTTPTGSGQPSTSGIGIAAAFPSGQPSSGSSPTSPPEETPSEIASNWVIETIESSEDVGQYSGMDYQLSNSGESTLHIVYFNSDSEELKYKKYDTTTGLHTAPETPGAYEDFGRYADISVLEDGKKHVSYYTSDPGTGDLGFSESMDPVEGWQYWGVDMGSDDVGQHTSIVVDSNGAPHIAYHDVTNNSLKHAWGEFQFSNYIWHIETVDGGGVGQYASLAIDNSDNLHIAYYSTQGTLKHGYGIPVTDGWAWSVDTAIAPVVGSSGEYSSIALDSSGNPHVVYVAGEDHDLEHSWAAWDQNLGTWDWQSQQVDGGIGNMVGTHVSLEIGSNDDLHAAYYDETHQALKYAHAPYGQIASVGSSGGWSWFPLTIENTGDHVGKYTDIALDDSGTVYITYYDETNGDLKLAHN